LNFFDCVGIDLGTVDNNGSKINKESLGIAYSGGGVRAASSAVGFIQVLNENELLTIKKIQYMSANSGGTWAVLPISYINSSKSYSLDYVAGEPVNSIMEVPSDGSLLHNIYSQTLKVNNWAEGVGKSFFDPYDLYKNATIVNIQKDFNIKQLNCSFTDVSCLKPNSSKLSNILKRPDFPIPIAIFTLWNSKDNLETPMDATPLSTGFLRKNTSIRDPSKKDNVDNKYAGRNTSAAFNAFKYKDNTNFKFYCNGNEWFKDMPRADFKLDVYNNKDDVNSRPWSPFAMSAASSNAAGKSAVGLAQGYLVMDLKNMNTSPYLTIPRKDNYLIDGAYVDNTSAASLFSRKVGNVAICASDELSVNIQNVDKLYKGKYYYLMPVSNDTNKNPVGVPIKIIETRIGGNIVDSISHSDISRQITFSVGGSKLKDTQKNITDLYGTIQTVSLRDWACEITSDYPIFNGRLACGSKDYLKNAGFKGGLTDGKAKQGGDGEFGKNVQRKREDKGTWYITMFNVFGNPTDKDSDSYFIVDIEYLSIKQLYTDHNILDGTYNDIGQQMMENYYNTGLYYYNGPVTTKNNERYNIDKYTPNVLIYGLLPCFSIYQKFYDEISNINEVTYNVNYCTGDTQYKFCTYDIPTCFCRDDALFNPADAEGSQRLTLPQLNLVAATTNYASEQLLVPFVKRIPINPVITASFVTG